MTFGLLSPGKGIETVIAALPEIVARHPETVYCIVGATHPNLLAREGERYRESLQSLSEACGVAAHIRWIDQFVETEELLDMIEMADIYVTPYLGAAQATSGTLSYAVALGKAVVSTPYVHATELLADGLGLLVPFESASAIAEAVNGLLGNPVRLQTMQQRAYQRGRAMIWPAFAARSLAIIEDVRTPPPPRRRDARQIAATVPSFDGIIRLSDDTGMLQHSRLSVPDRDHGYCIDDNARALMLMNRLDHDDAGRLARIYAAFIQHAWNADVRRFRNFMDFGRNWLEAVGSEDSNGRTLWALGATANEAPDARLRRWALGLFDEAADIANAFNSPRALAFAALGADHILACVPDHPRALAIIERAASTLVGHLAAVRRPDWRWFETVLAYDNCRLPEALLRIGIRQDQRELVERGIETLEWIMDRQTAPSGLFRPIGSQGFGADAAILPFDQQPVEIWAAIDACDAAYAATGDNRWIDRARHAFAWFFGENDRGIVIADAVTGTCCDGLTPRGVNLNEGAESTLAFHLGDNAFRALVAKSPGALIMPASNVELVA
jgi:Glycosyl transferases group 1